MTDALLDLFRDTIPPEILHILAGHLTAFEEGKFNELLSTPLVKLLLGHDENEHTRKIRVDDYHNWSDFVFDRIGVVLAHADDELEPQLEIPASRPHVLFLVAYAALQAFIQSNVTGPPLPFSSSEVIFLSSIAGDPTRLREARQELVSSLKVDGIAAYKLTPNIELLCLAETILIRPTIKKNVKAATWATLRINFLHQRLLSEVAPTLQAAIYEGYEAIQEILTSFEFGYHDSSTRGYILLEKVAIDLHHGFESQARQHIAEVAQLRQFQYALTGRLGKRTKFQEKDLSQLVVLAKSSNTTANDNAAPSADESRILDVDKGHKKAQPAVLDLNDDTLLESISFSEDNMLSTEVRDELNLPSALASLDPGDQPLLQPLDSIILLQLASSITNTSPSDGLTREETLPYAIRVLKGGSSNWQVYTHALLVRSRIEGFRSRTIERSLLQLQALVDQLIAETSQSAVTEDIKDKLVTNTFLPKAKEGEAAPIQERLQYIHQLNSPTRWELEAELAARWVNLGGLRSALDIYERLEMWAEAALCWAATDREDRARRIIRKQLFYSSLDDPNDEDSWNGTARDPLPEDAPRLYCILGDIDQNAAMYEHAWDISDARYARAQRSLGRHYFARRDFIKSADAYTKSLKINQLNGHSWFALGCTLLELAEYEKAAEAFSRTVQLDETDAEAWSNLAAALLRTGSGKCPGQTSDVSNTATIDSDSEDAQASDIQLQDPEKHKREALAALKQAAKLKHSDYRIWDNILTVSAALSPPSYPDLISATSRLLSLRGPTDGEKAIDADIIAVLVRHIVSLPLESATEPGMARLACKLVDTQVVPLITSSAKLWRLVAQLALWRGWPGSALECHEKAWRAVTSQPGWEHGTEEQWEGVVGATVELVEAYESLGERERTEGLGAQSGQVVMKDWKFKARSAVRGIMGKGKGSFEGTTAWGKLEEMLEALQSAR